MSMIKTVGLSYVYKKNGHLDVNGIDDLNISIEKNQIIGMIGETGSGKSTLAQIFNGLIKPTSGEIFLDGKNIWKDYKDIRDVHFKVGLTFQYPEHQLFGKTVYEDISFGPINQGLSVEEINFRVRTASEFVGIPFDIMNKSPFNLSGGEKRRVAIAGIIAMDPEVLILDEPTSGLDAKGKNNFLNSIKNYHKNRKNVVIFISHIMEDIARICDKVMVINKGSLKMFDTPQNVFSNYDILKNWGLEVPQITRIINKTFEKNHLSGGTIITVEQAFNKIVSMLGIHIKK